MKHVPMQHPSNEDLFAYRDGELSGEKRFLIEAHVVSCASCREMVDGMSGIEADLKSRPDDVGEEYYARMTESVLAKVGAKSGARAGAGAGASAKAPAPASGPAEEAPRVERRRPKVEPEAEGPRRRGLFPWFGVVGAGAAAAAVLVVVVMLAQRQGEWVRAPRPAGTGAPGEPLASRSDKAAETPPTGAEEGKLAGEKEKSDALARGAKNAPAREENAPAPAAGLAKQNEATSQKVAAEPEAISADEALGADKKMEVRKDAASGIAARRAVAPAAQAPLGDAASGVAAPAGGAGGAPPTEQYAAVLRAHGLPPVYDPARVDRDALLKAEKDLRYLYMAGRAETDSARVRLYLAEAARAKADPADSAAVEAVIHHYWRAIRLSRNDPAVSAMAWRRLGEYQRETGRQ